MKRILVTGATGYVGSHVCVELLAEGYDVVGADSFVNSSPVALDRIRKVAGRSIEFAELDIRDRAEMEKLFSSHAIDGVVHLAGLKAVGDSMIDPLHYYDVNVGGTLTLLETMAAAEVHHVVFSSSCTVYGNPGPEEVPLTERSPLAPVSPYGHTKLSVEEILKSLCGSDERWSVLSLRYFNPIGAHETGLIGEDPLGVPNNLLPFIMQTAVGRRTHVEVLGDDYPTPDGTCIRDYIHVVDLARGHLCALMEISRTSGFGALNLGTGIGSSVLEVIRAAENAVGHQIPHKMVDRRAGDAVAVFADVSEAAARLGWKADLDLTDMCRDHWNWQRRNPAGYSPS